MLNKQGPGKIDWTDYTWNPVSGCLHGCEYCYLKRLETRFGFDMKPWFHQDRLKDLRKIKRPSKIFVCSSADLFGDWVEYNWIFKVIETCRHYSQHTFQFLTKNPKRYKDFRFPENCWIGTSVDTQSRLDSLYDADFPNHHSRTQFISFEPLLERLEFNYERCPVDWVIIGANSNTGAKKPPNEWADEIIVQCKTRLRNVPVWIKDNYIYHSKIKEFPE